MLLLYSQIIVLSKYFRYAFPCFDVNCEFRDEEPQSNIFDTHSDFKYAFLIFKVNNLVRNACRRKTVLEIKRVYLAVEYASRTRSQEP